MRAIVLGCGPAGLAAVHAAAMSGFAVKIFSKARKSRMNGAQYLHRPLPGVGNQKPFTVSYELLGTPEGYRRRVYGSDGAHVNVSPESLVGTADAWDIRSAYDDLWGMYADYVSDIDMTPEALSVLIEQLNPELIISSIPAPVLCDDNHTFSQQSIWSTDTCIPKCPENTVICNGMPNGASWYRVSNIAGFENTEWSCLTVPKAPPIKPMWRVPKPIKTNCNCFPQVHRVGRYGKWKKGVLVHEAFEEVAVLCEALKATS